MKVFKFGGASVKDAPSVRNMANIISTYDEPLVIVISAMGKMTNALEVVINSYFSQDGKIEVALDGVIRFHNIILKDLFSADSHIFQEVDEIYDLLRQKISTEPSMMYDFEYDQIVIYGEILSSKIVHAFLVESGIDIKWIDVRKDLKTDNNYREARVLFDLSEELVKKSFSFDDTKLYLTQGFIGSTKDNLNTTLGREGSDYTAALLAYFLNAESVTVWKDVPGVLNADPKWFDQTVKLEKLTYADAIELAYYGASVIHPKTIQPLKKKNIPLQVKSFLHPKDLGTEIGNVDYVSLIPSFIFKMDQVLIDVYPKDLFFIDAENLQFIFDVLAKLGLKINLMQDTAVRFRICTNNDPLKIDAFKKALNGRYQVNLITGLELITIRYYDNATIERVIVNKEFILEQKGKATIQLLVKDLG
jgi:aspartate kinase